MAAVLPAPGGIVAGVTIAIRSETVDDRDAVYRVHAAAFGRPAEADLVDRLRPAARPQVSLVAVEDGEVVGHVFFSPVTVESSAAVFTAFGLAPLAVLPGFQRRGVGTALVREGLRACRRLGHHIVFVLGHPEYYPRFGFETAAARALTSVYDVRPEAFMVAEGTVKYRPEFEGID